LHQSLDRHLDRFELPDLYKGLCEIAEYQQHLLQDCDAPFGSMQEEEFVTLILMAASDAEMFDDRSASSARSKALKRALDYMNDRADEPVSIAEISSAAAVSWRTLHRSFKERFGVGPKTYFNRFRLGQVRSHLLKSGSGGSVADTANEWGFWHMGQFAKDYRRMFGELPSETLKTR